MNKVVLNWEKDSQSYCVGDDYRARAQLKDFLAIHSVTLGEK